MLKKFTLFIIIFLNFSSPLYAREISYYIGISGGEARTTINEIGLDKDKSYTLSTGLKFGPLLYPIKVEIEYLNLKSKKEFIVQTKTEGVAINSYIGIPLLPILEPYIGLGIANMKEKAKYDYENIWISSDWKLTPQYMIGIDIDLPTVSMAGGIEYRYIDTSFNFDREKSDTKIHTFFFKIRLKF